MILCSPSTSFLTLPGRVPWNSCHKWYHRVPLNPYGQNRVFDMGWSFLYVNISTDKKLETCLFPFHGTPLGGVLKRCMDGQNSNQGFPLKFCQLLGYDSHLILPYLTQTKIPNISHVNVVPRSSEKFLSISINQRVTFLDSL